MKNELLDAIKGFVVIVLFVFVAFAVGSFIGVAINAKSPAPIWYCIEGKVYEKMGDHYATVVPARACVPVDKD